MSRLTSCLSAFAILLLAACGGQRPASLGPVPDGALRLATYNVHYIILNRPDGAWSVGDWDKRKGPMDAAFKAIGPDLIAFQEMESFAGGGDANSDVNLARDWLLDRNPGYAAAASGDPADFPSTQPILYRTDRLELLDQDWFFFSDTPDVIYSRTFNGSFPAFAATTTFRDRTSGKRFHVFNMHFEYKSGSNRLRSAELVAARAAPLISAGERVIVTGDMNARAGSKTLKILENAGVTFLDVRGATYHFNRGIGLFGAIDHIGLSKGIAPTGPPVVIRDKFEGGWPTDHYPVIADVTLN